MKAKCAKLPDPPLLLVTDRSQARGSLADIIDEACAAGCRWVGMREKDLPAAEQVALARKLSVIARAHGGRVMLHGDAALAQAAGVDGVHLPAGADVTQARARLGAAALIAISVHRPADLAAAAAADYVIAGPAGATASKPVYGPALGAHGIAALAQATPVPIIAIGGIAPDNLAAFLQAGAAGVAVMGGVMRAGDAAAEIRTLLAAMNDAATR